jgi:hypothetical protein
MDLLNCFVMTPIVIAEIFKNLLKDKSYADRLKKHYQLFKHKIKKR